MPVMIKCTSCGEEITYPFQTTKEQLVAGSLTVQDIGLKCIRCGATMDANTKNCFWKD